MPDGEFVFDDKLLHAQLEENAKTRLARLTEGMDKLVEGRRKQAASLEALLADDRQLGEHAARLSGLTDDWGKGRQAIAAGKLSRVALAEKLAGEWQNAFSDESYSALKEAYQKTRATPKMREAEWLAHAFDLPEHRLRNWEGRYGELGWQHLRPLDDGEVGVIRQHLPAGPQPLSLCKTPPFDLRDTSSQTSGIAYVNVFQTATPATGRIFSMSTTIAPVFAGGGSDAWALVGTDVTFGPGFQTLSVSADIDFSSSLLAIAILGGAEAGAELVLRATMSDGRVFNAGSSLGSAVAPLLWHTAINQTGQRKVSLGTITLNGAAGTVRLMAGKHDHTAAVGVVGTSAGDSIQSATVLRICADFV